MVTQTNKRIIEYINKHGQATIKELVDYFAISKQALFRHINNLQAENKITKIGRPPKVYYFLKETQKKEEFYNIDKALKRYINENYLIITPAGERKDGWEGFVYWCERNNQPVIKTAHEYKKTSDKYKVWQKEGLINGLNKIKNTFKKNYLNYLFYLDFYSIERFGKTKLGQLLLYAKQSQNKKIIKELILAIKPKIEHIIKKYKIDGVGFIPPTVKREVQFMKELENNLSLKIKKINIAKIKTEISVPQKTLSKLSDRIENAKKTIILEEKSFYKNILLIDDAVGSGATLNETAGQVRKKKICSGKIVGLAITGSYKGFDIISEI